MATQPTPLSVGAWNTIDVLVRQGFNFLTVIALLAFFTSLSVVFLQGGLSIALIQRQQTTRDQESAVFWWNLGGSIIFGAAVVLIGPALAEFFEQPVLRSLVVVAALQLIFSAAGAVHTALLTREMRFDLLTIAGVAASVSSGIVAITAAAMGLGVWALALQLLTLALINTVALWIALPWRPAPHFRFDTIRDFFGFGAWVSAGNLLEVFYTNGVALLIGKLHGVRDLGFYNQASATQLLPSSALSTIVGRVALPLLASSQNDPIALKGSLRLAIRCVMVVNLPAMVGLALLSDVVVEVLFGRRWLPAAPILSILALGGALLPLHFINVQFVLARGQTGTFVKNEIVKKSLGIICVLTGSLFGVIGLAWSQVVYSVLGLIVNAYPARRELKYGAFRQLWDLAWAGAVTLIMAVGVVLTRRMLPGPPVVTLAVCTLVGGSIYAALGWLSKNSVFRDPVILLSQALKPERTAVQ
jgi:O-antigen/teichoic acid export membrane protein